MHLESCSSADLITAIRRFDSFRRVVQCRRGGKSNAFARRSKARRSDNRCWTRCWARARSVRLFPPYGFLFILRCPTTGIVGHVRSHLFLTRPDLCQERQPRLPSHPPNARGRRCRAVYLCGLSIGAARGGACATSSGGSAPPTPRVFAMNFFCQGAPRVALLGRHEFDDQPPAKVLRRENAAGENHSSACWMPPRRAGKARRRLRTMPRWGTRIRFGVVGLCGYPSQQLVAADADRRA